LKIQWGDAVGLMPAGLQNAKPRQTPEVSAHQLAIGGIAALKQAIKNGRM